MTTPTTAQGTATLHSAKPSETTEGHARVVEGYVVKRLVAIGQPEDELREKVDNEHIAVHRFATVPAEVFYEAGATLNMGNYESVRLTIGIRMPCYREEANEAFDMAKAWVESRLEQEVLEARRHGI